MATVATMAAAASWFAGTPPAAAAPPAAHWVGTWSAAEVQPDSSGPSATGFANQTIREVVHSSIGGGGLRVRLTNVFGGTPLAVAAAEIGVRQSGAKVVPGTNHAITTSGSPSFVIPPGAATFTDPVALPTAAGSDLVVSVYVTAPTGPATWHPAAITTTYVAAGNHAADDVMPYQGSATSWFFLSGVDTDAALYRSAIVALGASTTDGVGSTFDADRRWIDDLNARIELSAPASAPSVLNEGISGNRLLTEGGTAGQSGEHRFARDALRQSGAQTVIVSSLGNNDIGDKVGTNGRPISANDLIAGYQQLIANAHGAGLRIIGGTLTPDRGAFYFSAAGELIRQQVNRWILTAGAFDVAIDFATSVASSSDPSALLPAFDSGDHLHLNDAGYQAMAIAAAGAVASGLVFSGEAPTRVCDTRPSSVSGITDVCTGHRLAAGAPLVVNLPLSVVPPGAGAVVANVTVTRPTATGYLSVYPTGAKPPASSNLNFVGGQTVANLVTVATGMVGGRASISVVDGAGPPGEDVVIDVEGYDSAATDSTAGGFHPLAPARVADTRCLAFPAPPFCAGEALPAANRSLAKIGPGGQDQVTVTGVGGVPASGVSAVVVNVTVVAPSVAGFVTVAPSGSIPEGSTPGSSSLNFTAGNVLANKAIVPVGADGTISVYNDVGTTDAMVDEVGWYAAPGGPPGATFTPVSPVRLADTRCAAAPSPSFCPAEVLPGRNITDGPPFGGSSIHVAVGGTGTVPSGIAAATLGVTDVSPRADNYLTVYPMGAPIPATSDVNWTTSDADNIVPGSSYAGTGTNAAVDVLNGMTPAATTDVIVDLFGYYTPPLS
ncbi:MAG: GDSL-type esterase/lipase family protein [Actinomycetota bacterium]|nr:GDSL-type esterase/lipase family protein [Actinomycetota bacterium]